MLNKRVRLFGKSLPILVPIGVTLAVVAVAVAAILITVTQTVHQNIVSPPPPPDYGTITADDITLPDLVTGASFSESIAGGVVVELGPDGVGKYLHLKLDESSASLYDSLRVQISSPCPDNPMNTAVFCTVGTGAAAEGPHMSWGPLTEVGTYTFAENINGTAGDTTGAADVQVTVSLEDEPAAVNKP